MWDYFLCALLLAAPIVSQPQQQSQTTSDNGNTQQSPSNNVNIQQETNANNGITLEQANLNKPVEDKTPYQVTETIIDRPDDRTLPPIDPTYGINVPLNLGNNTNINTGHTVPEVTEAPENKDTTEKNNLKKNSFSYVQIKGEFDDQMLIPNFLPNYNTQVETPQNNIGFKRFLDGIKSYIFSMKKGLVDGLHSWYNKNNINRQIRKEIDNFHRSFKEDSDPEFEASGDIDIENWFNREDFQKEIFEIYKSLNEASAEDGDDKSSDNDYDEYGDDYGDPHFHHHKHDHKGRDCK